MCQYLDMLERHRVRLMRVYLAGPEVFWPNAKEIGAAKKALCLQYGLEGLFPLDADLQLEGIEPRQKAMLIGSSCHEMISLADAVIANCTPFRGVSADVGTAYEMGLAEGMGRPVWAYTTVMADYADRVRAWQAGLPEMPPIIKVSDDPRLMIEEFGLADNLMLESGLEEQSMVRASTTGDAPFLGLAGFAQCLQAVHAHFAAQALK